MPNFSVWKHVYIILSDGWVDILQTGHHTDILNILYVRYLDIILLKVYDFKRNWTVNLVFQRSHDIEFF